MRIGNWKLPGPVRCRSPVRRRSPDLADPGDDTTDWMDGRGRHRHPTVRVR